MKIGVISDTHGFLDPQIPPIFNGVEHILHAGDVGPAWILSELEQLAPVTAVLGNNDWGLPCALTELVCLGGRKFLLHHILDSHAPTEKLRLRIAREKPDVIVFGHTHKSFCEMIGSSLYLNPGYAGKSRFKLPRSVAVLETDANGIVPRFYPL